MQVRKLPPHHGVEKAARRPDHYRGRALPRISERPNAITPAQGDEQSDRPLVRQLNFISTAGSRRQASYLAFSRSAAASAASRSPAVVAPKYSASTFFSRSRSCSSISIPSLPERNEAIARTGGQSRKICRPHIIARPHGVPESPEALGECLLSFFGSKFACDRFPAAQDTKIGPTMPVRGRGKSRHLAMLDINESWRKIRLLRRTSLLRDRRASTSTSPNQSLAKIGSRCSSHRPGDAF